MVARNTASVRSLAKRLDVDPPDEIGDGVDWALPIISSLRDRGLSVLLKLDGDRPAQPATVVVSGPVLEGEFIRGDGETLGATLSAVFDELETRLQGD
jgi:hypothetical protein